MGSEIVSQIISSCFEYLKFPPIRLGMPDYPTPSSRGYLKNHYPNQVQIITRYQNFLTKL